MKRYLKKHRIIRILFVLLVLFLFVALLFQIQCRTIHASIKDSCDEIYIPGGIADAYTDLLTFSIDEHKIWEYKLNANEKKKAEENLNCAVWNKITNSNIADAKFYFTVNSDSYWPDDISEDSYYCIYHFSLKRFIKTDELVGHTALFIYDKANSRYYCVSLSI